jgi:hypothetical protein
MKFLQKHSTVVLIAAIALLAVLASAAMVVAALTNARTGLSGRPAVSIRFIGEDGEIMLEKAVPMGAFAIPPSDVRLSGNQVMQGWHGSMLNVMSDSDCRISVKDISEETNVFYIDTRYVPCGASFETDVRIGGGKVSLSGIELALPYDDRALRYETSKSEIGVVEKKEDGELGFRLGADKTISEGMILFSVKFAAVGSPFSFVELKPSVSKATTRLADGTETSEYQVIPAKIYLYDKEASK